MAVGHATARWDTPSGLRFGSGDQSSLSIDLKAYPHVREGTLTSVTFHVSVNGGAASDVGPVTESMRVGDFTTQDSPLPGVTSGLAELFCCGFDQALNSGNAGTITISATVRSTKNGTNYDTEVGAITIYNDHDGVDRRPTNNVVYVSPSGDDGNDGSEGSPVGTLCGGIERLVSLGGKADIAGAEIIMMPGENLIGGHFGFSSWETSGERWLTVTFQEGASISRTLDGSGETVYPDTYVTCAGNGAGTYCRIRFVNATIIGDGLVGYIPAGVLATFWFDGGVSKSSWDDGLTVQAKYLDDGGSPVSWDGTPTNGRAIATCHSRAGVSDGFVSFSYLRDCIVDRWIGIAYYDADLVGTGDATWRSSAMHTVNCYSAHQDYIYENDGVDNSIVSGLIDYQGGTNFNVSAQVGGTHNGKMKITCVSPPYFPFFVHAGALSGSRRLGLLLSNFSANNNGFKAVLEAGSNYVILDDSTITAQTPAGATARIVTSDTNSNEYWSVVHPDIWRIQGNKQNFTVQGLGTATTVLNTQAIFLGGDDISGAVFDGITTPTGCRNNLDGAQIADCRFREITSAFSFDFNSSNCTGSIFHDIVFESASALNTSNAAVLNRLHSIQGSAIGTSGTNGSWFENYALYDYLPKASVRGLNSNIAVQPTEDKWEADSAWTQGVGQYGPGTLDWSSADEQGATSYAITGYNGIVTVNGQSANLFNNQVMQGNASATYIINGKVSQLLYGHLTKGQEGRYVLNGGPAALTVGKLCTGNAKQFFIQGQNATMQWNRLISGDKKDIVVNGQNAALMSSEIMAAFQGAYQINGGPAALLKGRYLSSLAGTYQINGQPNNLMKGFLIPGEKREIVINGQEAVLFKGVMITLFAFPKLYNISGQIANLTKTTILPGENNSYSISGGPANLTKGYFMLGQGGSLSVSTSTSETMFNRILQSTLGSYQIDDTDILAEYDKLLSIAEASYVINGEDVELQYRRVNPSSQKKGRFRIFTESF